MNTEGFILLGNCEIYFSNVIALADLGGMPGTRSPPTGPNSFIFPYIFAEKHQRQGSTYPLWKILDPPLNRDNK